MQITIETKAAKAALALLTGNNAQAGPVIMARPTIPILGHVLLSCGAAGITIAGSDLDISAECALPGEGTLGAVMCVEARTLKDALAKSKAVRVTLADLGGNRAALSSECGTGATIKLAALPPADFPKMQPQETCVAWTAPAAQLAQDLARLSPCMSREETRYYLNGILMHIADERGEPRFRMAATDGHRLARIDREVPEGMAGLADTIVPRMACGLLGRVLGKKPDGDVRMTISASQVRFEFGGWVIRSKVVDGTYPDYSRAIPSGNQHEVAIDPCELSAEVESVTSHISDRVRGVTLTAGGGWGTLWACDVDSGPAGLITAAAVMTSNERDTDGKTPDCVSAGVNAKYLVTMLAAFGKAQVTAHIYDASAPMLFKCADTPEFLGVLMPLRTDRGHVTPDDIRALTKTPVEALEEAAPSAGQYFGLKVRAAIDHQRGSMGGDRQAARLAILAKVESMRGEPGRASAILARCEALPGGFARWVGLANAIEARAADARRERPSGEHMWQEAQDKAEVRLSAKQLETAHARLSLAAAAQDNLESAVMRLETRNRRLVAVLAGRKRQLAAVGEALIISRERSARLSRQSAASGVSLSALATVR